MSREFDLRTSGDDGTLAQERMRAVARVREAPAGGGVRVVRTTLEPEGAMGQRPSGLTPDSGDMVSRALSFLTTMGPAMGFAAAAPLEFMANPYPGETSAGAYGVYAAQHYKGIPIFQAAHTVVFDPSGTLQRTSGTTVQPPPDDLSSRPKQSAIAAASAAVAALRDGTSPDTSDGFGNVLKDPALPEHVNEFVILGQFADRSDLPTVVSSTSLAAPAPLSLVWFPLEPALVLCWQIILTLEGHVQYNMLVDASSNAVLYSSVVSRAIVARGLVYRSSPDEPRVQVPFPLPLETYGLRAASNLPANFPYPWVDANLSAGVGVISHLSDAGEPIACANDAAGFAPTDPLGADQCVLNAFYCACYLHDAFYLLGFREADGNFQADDFGQGGMPSDRVNVCVFQQPIWATANMSTPVDGVSPQLRLGTVAATGRSTALDASVVFHEASHGLTSRLVGGALDSHSLEQPQSAGMSEGWSDFFACQMLQTEVVGAWVTNDAKGVRAFAYDAAFPATFAAVGTGRYRESHALGEIWCATLMAVARSIGRPRALALTVDSLKLLPSNPSFIDGRDAMFAALEHSLTANALASGDYDTIKAQLWQAFATAGLGPAASADGAALSGVRADFTNPVAASSSAAAWTKLGAAGPIPTTAALSAVSTASAAELFVTGGDGRVYHAIRTPGSHAWSPWTAAGLQGSIPPTAPLSAVSTPVGTELFVTGADGRVYHATRMTGGATWSAWTAAGTAGTVPPTAPLSAVSSAAGEELFVTGGDGQVYHATRIAGSGAWSPWTVAGTQGAISPTAPLAAAVTSLGTALFVTRSDGTLSRALRSSSSGYWSAWTAAGARGTVPPKAPLTAAVNGDAIELFVTGGDGYVYHASLG